MEISVNDLCFMSIVYVATDIANKASMNDNYQLPLGTGCYRFSNN